MAEYKDINGQYEYFKAINVYMDGDLAVHSKDTNALLTSLQSSIEDGNMVLSQLLLTMIINIQQVNSSVTETNQLLTMILQKDNSTDMSGLIDAVNNQSNDLDLTPLVDAVNNNKQDLTPIVDAINGIESGSSQCCSNELTIELKRWMVVMYQSTVKSVLLANEYNKIKEQERRIQMNDFNKKRLR